MKNKTYYNECTEHAQELYWYTLGKLRDIEVIKTDIEYTISKDRSGPERIFRINIENSDVDERLNKIVADIKAGIIPDSLLISPNSLPHNVTELLIEKGFTKDISGACMSMDLKKFKGLVPYNDNIFIKKVENNDLLSEWVRIINAELFEGEILTYNQFVELLNLDYSELYIGYYYHEPVSICLTLSDDKLADIAWVATTKEYRRKGIALKTISKALDDLKYNGVETVSLRADPMAINVYKKAGFKEYSKRIVMKCDYNQVYKKTCCQVDERTINMAEEIFSNSVDIESFILEMDEQRVIGSKIWLDSESNTIFITKKYANECGGGCEDNDSLIGRRCHCGYMNNSSAFLSKDYCKCSAEFFRPIFEPLLGRNLIIEPISTVLSGDDNCTFAIKGCNFYTAQV